MMMILLGFFFSFNHAIQRRVRVLTTAERGISTKKMIIFLRACSNSPSESRGEGEGLGGGEKCREGRNEGGATMAARTTAAWPLRK